MPDQKPTQQQNAPTANTAARVLSQETEEIRLSLPVGLGAILAAGASLVTCYAGILADYVLGFGGLALNPHVQAILMWALALLAVLFLRRDQFRHHSILPMAIGGLAALILIITLYFGYDERIEALAYVLLVIAALLNQILLLNVLNKTVLRQSGEIAQLNASLTRRVERQEHEIGRLERLKQFLAPQVAELVVAEGNEAMLNTHRRYIACVFCDIRNFTTVSEAIEPEDVISILQRFHDQAGGIVARYGGTLGYRAGDGLMVFFNDPIPCDDPVMRAVRLAVDIRSAFEELRAEWLELGHRIGLGTGIASGYATLGLVGLHGRSDYTAIGGVVNTSARLCDMAGDKEILMNHRAFLDTGDALETDPLGAVDLKGMSSPVEVHRVLGMTGDENAPVAPAATAGSNQET